MKVLFLVESATIGGHVISALTTARSLKGRGHEVTVISGEGPLAETFAAEFTHAVIPFHFNHVGRQTYFSFKSLETVRALARVCRRGHCDVIHAYDARSYIVAYLYSTFVHKIPITATMCGGLSPYYNIPLLGKLILFSEEQKQKMKIVYGWSEEHLAVIRNRIYLALFDGDDESARAELEGYGIACDERLVMMVTTFLGPKVLSIRQALEAMEGVVQRVPGVRFVIVGGKGDFYPEAREIGKRINERVSREAVVFTGLVKNAYRFLRYADVVLGQGRSAFEGMGFQKPTLIIGDKGYAGTIQDCTIDDIAFYNFSGRNCRDQVALTVLASEITRLLEDEKYAEDVAIFGEEYVRRELDIEAGVERILDVYQENRAWFERQSRWKLACHLGWPLLPILADNYLNAAKKVLAPS